MTEKELKKLNRYQLLELIIIQTEEMEKLKKELEDTKAKLEKQQIMMAKAGNIAEASLQLSGIFEAAQRAADVYLESVKVYADRAEEIVELAKVEAKQIALSARSEAHLNNESYE